MRLSIITINYNNNKGLIETIKSVVGQSWNDYEWVVIDGGSADGSKDLIEQHSEKFSFWCSEPDTGIYNAMNKGITYASGDWLLFLNSGDCLYTTDTLERVFHNQYDSDIIYGDRVIVENGKEIINKYPNQLGLDFFYHYSLCHQATFYRRELFDGCRYDESFAIAGDWAFFIDMMFKGKTFKHIDIPIVLYDNNGISSKYSEKQIAEIERVRAEKFPEMFKSDIEKLNKWKFVEKRRSLTTLYDCSYKLLVYIDRLLNKFERRSK